MPSPKSERGERFATQMNRRNLTAAQFHPGKSGGAGSDLVRNWLPAA